ncbi:hypothetical protein ACFXA2_11685 [Micromonospora chalcea]
MKLTAINRTQNAANLMITEITLDQHNLGEVAASEAPRHHHFGELELIMSGGTAKHVLTKDLCPFWALRRTQTP